MSHLPPAHHETSKHDSPNETKVKEKKTKQNYPGFEFKPRQVNDSSQSNQETDHLVSPISASSHGFSYWSTSMRFFQKFREFQNLAERLFDKKILMVQIDWGGEYKKLNTFFHQTGISHHVSCPYAHQQNGSAKRKHRHIVEVGLSLLAVLVCH
jgi:hypothetical protein